MEPPPKPTPSPSTGRRPPLSWRMARWEQQEIAKGATRYVKADGTLSDSEADVGALTGTEITDLINGNTYKVEIYQPANINAPVLSATVGNAYVKLSWTTVADTVAYSVYQSMTSAGYDEALAQVAGSVYSYESTGLKNGTTYYFVVKAIDYQGNSTVSNEVSATPYRKSSSSDNSGDSGDSSTNNTVSNTFNIQVNGKTESAASFSISVVNNKIVTTVVIDDNKVNERLKSEGNNAVVTIGINNNSDTVIGSLNGQTVKNMENKEAVIEIKTEKVRYTLPASQINIDAIKNQTGTKVELKDINVRISINTPSEDTIKVIEDTAK